jgi:hypothetical protein
MNTDIELIKKILNAATPGPWKSYIEGRDHTSGSSFIMTGDDDYDIDFTKIRNDDQDFIAFSRNILPELILEIESLRERLKKYE